MTRGQIYLNTSLTESFGISIIEAACAGLFVVSTKVGGVPEILPGEMIEFARADEDGSSPSLVIVVAKLRWDRCNKGTERGDSYCQVGKTRSAQSARAGEGDVLVV